LVVALLAVRAVQYPEWLFNVVQLVKTMRLADENDVMEESLHSLSRMQLKLWAKN
jgi:hypothetical protein